jgi:ubiquinone biosynthesis protein
MRRLSRLIRIFLIICRYRLDQFIPLHRLPERWQWVFRLGPWHFFTPPETQRGQRLKEALEALGPIHVKFGQLLSTRPDLVPDDIAEALAELQDRVTPFPGEVARDIVEKTLKKPVTELFNRFETQPMASASIAQVHAASLLDGREVVVKVIRPDIHQTIIMDLQLLLTLAGWLERFWPESRRLHPVQVVEDYQLTLMDELDMMKEAANTSQLRRNFPNTPLLYIPEVHWDLTRECVLVMERIYGVPISDLQTLRASGANLKLLAERGVEIFFTQVFRDSFFHADMHPGNIFVDISRPGDPRYIAVDCGIVGTLSPQDQSYLARNLMAFFRRDYRQVAELHISSGWIPRTTRVNEFESAIRSVCEPIFARPLKDISFGQFLVRLFQTARRFDMEVQPQLVLLQKTLLNIEGLGRQLYPDLDLWATAMPFLEKWLKDRITPPGLLKVIQRQLPQWLEQTPEMPDLIYQAFDRIRNLETLPASYHGRQKDQAETSATSAKRHRHLKWGATLLGLGLLTGTPAGAELLHDMSLPALLAAVIGSVLLLRSL